MILVDEPFAAVDAQTASVLLDQVTHWHQEGRTVIAVLHDLELVRTRFPSTLVLARRCVAWGEAQGHSVLLPKTTSMAAWRYSAKCSNPSTGLKPRRRRSASAVLRTAASTCGAWPALVRD